MSHGRFLNLARAGLMLMLGAAVPAGAQVADAAGQQTLAIQRGVTSSALELTTNSAVAVESERPFAELSIANPGIADISTLSDRSIYVLGKNPGRTTLMLMGADGQVLTVVDILVTPDITELKARLTQILPGEDITAITAADGVVLTGKVSSASAMTQAVELAGRYAPGRVSNLLQVNEVKAAEKGIDTDGLRQQLATFLPGEPVEVSVANGALVLSGAISSKTRIDQALKIASSYAPGEITNLMTSTEVAVAPDAEKLIAQIRAILPGEEIDVHTVATTVVLSGTASSGEKASQAVQLAKLFAPQSDVTSLITVKETRGCFIRTRRGGEMIETAIPCAN